MTVWTPIIAALALILATINFYWTFLRQRKFFRIIPIQDIPGHLLPEFALVNGGKHSILITRLECTFVRDAGRASYTPPQRIRFEESESLLIPAGSGIHCKVNFLEKFTGSFALTGIPEKLGSKSDFYMHDMHLNISWVEMDGERHEKTLKFCRYGFREDGTMAARVGTFKQIDLYQTFGGVMSETAGPNTFWDRKWVLALMAFIGSLVGGLFTHFLSEHSRSHWQEVQWKQERYHQLIIGAEGFLASTPPAKRQELQTKFMTERNLCRIYCPDNIIRELNIFTDTIFSPPNTYPGRDASLYYRNFVLALRKDLLPKSRLVEKDLNF